MQLSLYAFIWLFFIYAFLGWCTEVGYAALCSGKFVNRGFLNGPVCPVYGFGLVLVIALLSPLQDSLILLFLGAFFLTSALEFITGWALEKLFHAKWWDYSNVPFNIKGYVCLKFSIAWGLAATFILKVVQPLVMKFIGIIPQWAGYILLAVFLSTILADAAATVVSVRSLQQRLQGLAALGDEIHDVSDRIGSSLSGALVSGKQRASENLEKFAGPKALLQSHLAEEKALVEAHRAEERALREKHRAEEKSVLGDLTAEFHTRMSALKGSHKRLLRAFPDLKMPGVQSAIGRVRRYLDSKEPESDIRQKEDSRHK